MSQLTVFSLKNDFVHYGISIVLLLTPSKKAFSGHGHDLE